MALGCALLSPTPWVAAEAPEAGEFLIASRQLQGPTFRETVILMLDYAQDGAIGLIVNRPTEVPPLDVLPEIGPLADYQGNLYLGGPVEIDSLRALLRTDTPPANAVEVFDGVYLIGLTEDNIAELADSEANIRFYVGYSGWGPGQLDSELERGSWHVKPASREGVFADDPKRVWRQLVPPVSYSVDAGTSP